MQAEAAAAEVAGGRGQHADQPRRAQQPHDHPGDHRAAAEEAHLHRDQRARRAGEGLHAEPQAHLRGDLHAGRRALHGEGGGAGLVLQPAAEGEADQPPVGRHGVAVLGAGGQRRHVRHRQLAGLESAVAGHLHGAQLQPQRDGEAGMTARRLLHGPLPGMSGSGLGVVQCSGGMDANSSAYSSISSSVLSTRSKRHCHIVVACCIDYA